LYAADHSLFAASIAALILSWPQAVGAVNSTTKIAEEIARFIFMALPPVWMNAPDELRTAENRVPSPATLQAYARRWVKFFYSIEMWPLFLFHL
jgi:hypothetical protein